MKKQIFIITALSFLFIINCSGNDTYTEEIIDGVRHIHNLSPKWGEEDKLGLEFIRKIGEIDTEDDNYALHSIQCVSRDKDGNIYITDSGNYRVQKYDKNCNYILTIGSQGEGPGEFTRPYKTDIGPDNKIYISDVSKMHIFSLEGEFERTFRLTSTVTQFKILNSGNFLMGRGIFYRGRMDQAAPYLARITDDNDSTIVELGEPTEYANAELDRFGNMNGSRVDSEDNIYLGFLFQNRIDKYSSDGKMIFSADRPLNYTLSHRIDQVEFEASGRIYTRDAAVFTHVAASFDIDHKNRLWVRTYKHDIDQQEIRKAKDLVFEVFDSEGFLLCRVPHPDHDGRLIICGDHIYFISYDYDCLYEYMIIE